MDQILRYNTFDGAKMDEIGPAHLDCFQYFDTNGEYGRRFEVCYNVLHDTGEVFMGEMKHSADLAGDWTFHHNIISRSWAWGICDVGIPRVKTLNDTFCDIKWNGVGALGSDKYNQHNPADGCVIQNNIFQNINQVVKTDATAKPQRDHNIIFKCGTNAAGEKDLVNVDPLMADPDHGNFRLQRGSSAIGAGDGGVTIGALEYPNVYYVDPRHPAATDDGFGYPGQPYKTLAKALEVAQAGETIVVRGGVIRETLKAKSDGVTVRAMKGEKVIISGADLIEGWQCGADGAWSAPLAAELKKVLRDGAPWSDFTYDKAGGKIVVKGGGDPRLHAFETLVRKKGIDLDGRKDVKVEGIEVVDTLGQAAPRGAK